MNTYPLVLTVMIVLGVLYYAYLSIDWEWWNPSNVTKGLVSGSALKHEAWKERDKVMADRAVKRAKERADVAGAEHKTWNDALNADIDAKLSSVMKRIDTRRAGAFHRVQDENHIDGEISGGVLATPQEYADRYGVPKTETEQTLEKLKRIREASNEFKDGF